MLKPAKKHLSFGSLRECMSREFRRAQDTRQEGKILYGEHDVLMCAFSMMHFQDPSLLQFQKRMREGEHRDNLQSLFDVQNIPRDSQMRAVIDVVDPEVFRPIFKSFADRLQRGKYLEQYQLFPGLHLVVGDGTQYASSQNLSCSGCLTSRHRNGTITYSHKILGAAIMHPDRKQVLPIMPEEIRNSDGMKKQDCEQNAAIRLIRKIRADHPRMGIIFGGDGLYSKLPMIEELLRARMHYILVCKPKDHKHLTAAIEEKAGAGTLCRKEVVDERGHQHVYEWANEMDLTKMEYAFKVNFFSYRLIVPQGNGEQKTTYRNSWVTDLEITDETVEQLVRGGRARWKIENECFNTLKNQGYHIEHNYGHGKKHLSFNFLLLTLLAFYFHQIFELTDDLYRACREKFGSKRHMWETLRAYIKIIVFQSWRHLMEFALNPRNFNVRLDTS